MDNKDLEYATEIRKARRKTGIKTQEFFTPKELVEKMLDKAPEDSFSDFSKTFLEPSAGNGNFVVAFLERRFNYCTTPSNIIDALSTMYSVELMQDNVDEMKERVFDLCFEKFVSINPNNTLEEASNFRKNIYRLMDSNFVCSDFFKWNFNDWRPYTEEELKIIAKKKK